MTEMKTEIIGWELKVKSEDGVEFSLPLRCKGAFIDTLFSTDLDSLDGARNLFDLIADDSAKEKFAELWSNEQFSLLQVWIQEFFARNLSIPEDKKESALGE